MYSAVCAGKTQSDNRQPTATRHMQYLFVISVEIGRLGSWLNNSPHKGKSRGERVYFHGTSSDCASRSAQRGGPMYLIETAPAMPRSMPSMRSDRSIFFG